jgi:hypothetical protein
MEEWREGEGESESVEVEGREKGMRKGRVPYFHSRLVVQQGEKVEGFGVVPSFTALFVLIRADYSDRTRLLISILLSFSFSSHSILVLILTLLYSLFSVSILHSFYH